MFTVNRLTENFRLTVRLTHHTSHLNAASGKNTCILTKKHISCSRITPIVYKQSITVFFSSEQNWVSDSDVWITNRVATFSLSQSGTGSGASASGMASAGARAYIGGLGAEPPAGSRGRAPGQGVRGPSPLELKTFQLLDAQRKQQICLILSEPKA